MHHLWWPRWGFAAPRARVLCCRRLEPHRLACAPCPGQPASRDVICGVPLRGVHFWRSAVAQGQGCERPCYALRVQARLLRRAARLCAQVRGGARVPVRLQNDGAAAAGEEQPTGAGVQGGQAVAGARLLLGARGGGAGRGVGGAAGTCFVGQRDANGAGPCARAPGRTREAGGGG